MKYDKYKDGPIHHRWYSRSSHPEHAWYKQVIDTALDNVVGKSVLDVGCGDGLFLKLAQEKGLEVMGVDNDATGLEYALANVPNADLFMLDVNTYDPALFPDLVVDTLVCINTIEHLEEPSKVVDMFTNNCKKRAIIITDVPKKNKGRYHTKEWFSDELLELFQGTFKQWKTIMLGNYYALILDK